MRGELDGGVRVRDSVADLMARIEALPLGAEGAAFDFTSRLASENGWTRGFAGDVVVEYRKFLVLCAISPVPVTPSDPVDQAWHLHLVYTRSYWNDLCRDTLGKPLHHGPTEGGEVERDKFFDWYGRTLELYEETFGVAAPVAIWPLQGERFVGRFRRVDVYRNWVVPKVGKRALVGSGLVAGALTLIGCSLAEGSGDSKFVLLGVVLVVFFLLANLASALVGRGKRGRRRRGKRGGSRDSSSWWGGCGSGCSNGNHGNDSGCGGGGGGCGGGGD